VKSDIASYIKSQIELPQEQHRVQPDELFMPTKLYFRQDLEFGSEDWKRAWNMFCASRLYKNAIGLTRQKAKDSSRWQAKDCTDWRVKKSLYKSNNTLNALITFCAVKNNDLPEPWKTS
jgi:hypothetical protein